MLDKLVAVGEITKMQVKERITEEESDALLLLNECNGDYEAA
jgi:hypothetical protein